MFIFIIVILLFILPNNSLIKSIGVYAILSIDNLAPILFTGNSFVTGRFLNNSLNNSLNIKRIKDS